MALVALVACCLPTPPHAARGRGASGSVLTVDGASTSAVDTEAKGRNGATAAAVPVALTRLEGGIAAEVRVVAAPRRPLR